MKPAVFTKSSLISHPIDKVFNWHKKDGALERLSPPFAPVKVISKPSGLDIGTKVHLKIKSDPIWLDWQAIHTRLNEPYLFEDIQEKGPFKCWIHTHTFSKKGDQTLLTDTIRFQLPMPNLSFLMNFYFQKELSRIFHYRHLTTQRDLDLHQKSGLKPGMRIAVTGASGLLGSSLVPFFTAGGYDVYTLVRKTPEPGKKQIFWDPIKGLLNPDELEGFDVIIHLAGDNIGESRWREAKKERIISSRVNGTQLLCNTLSKLQNPPEVFLCASAIGYYGDTGNRMITETAPKGDQFISHVCDVWEKAAEPLKITAIRPVFLRIGIVLSPEGGALSKLLLPFKLGLGAKNGVGSQYMSWISLPDVIGSIVHLITTPEISGPVNLTAPSPVTSLTFTKTLSGVLKRPAVFTIPSRIIKALFGQMGEEILLSGSYVKPAVLEKTGYRFFHPDLRSCLKETLGVS